MGVRSFFGKIFSFLKEKDKKDSGEEFPPVRKSFGYRKELAELREKADRFFVTRKKNSGLIHESKYYKILKNGPKLLGWRERKNPEENILLSSRPEIF